MDFTFWGELIEEANDMAQLRLSLRWVGVVADGVVEYLLEDGVVWYF